MSPDLWPSLTSRIRAYIADQCSRGVSVVTVRIVVRDGAILQWERPKAVHFEPSSEDSIIALLTESQDRDIVKT